jgi:hypothetical protein
MAIQLSVGVRNAMLDAVESTIGTSAVLKIRTGAQPATVATADSGTVLATLSHKSQNRHLGRHKRRRNRHGGAFSHLCQRWHNGASARLGDGNRRRR